LDLLGKDKREATVNRDAAIQAASLQVQQEMLVALQPVLKLFALTSMSKNNPGDRYLA
jgi:hypothetical protein